MRKFIFFTAVFGFYSSCLRLDDNLYNPDPGIDSYKFDKFDREVDFVPGPEYALPADKVYLFTLNSGAGKVYATYVGDTNSISNDTVILYLHGNRWHMDFYWPRVKLLSHCGGKMRFGVMTLDYRGFGLSEGKPTEEGMYEDVDKAMQWLKSKGLSNERLVVYGFSLGSAPAVKLSAEPRSMKPSKLILEAPMASAELMVQEASVLAMPSSFFVDLKIDNAGLIKNVEQPFFWVHGVADDFLSMKVQGETVYKNYRGSYSEAHRIENAGHGSVPNTWGFNNYNNALRDFIIR